MCHLYSKAVIESALFPIYYLCLLVCLFVCRYLLGNQLGQGEAEYILPSASYH